MDHVYIYTDGACKGNPGPGGWGCYLCFLEGDVELFGSELETTNNRMELRAAIEALDYLSKSYSVSLYTDSQYLVKGMTEWLEGWKSKGWRTASKKPVVNQDLWEMLDKLNKRHNIDWQWVKGHDENIGNIKADELANKGVVAAYYA